MMNSSMLYYVIIYWNFWLVIGDMLFDIGCIMHDRCFINNAAYCFTVVYCWLLDIEQSVII